MQKFVCHEGLAVPLDAANVDTDQIIPKQFLQAVSRAGFGKHLFNDWRYLDEAGTVPNPDFILAPAVSMLHGHWQIMVSRL